MSAADVVLREPNVVEIAEKRNSWIDFRVEHDVVVVHLGFFDAGDGNIRCSDRGEKLLGRRCSLRYGAPLEPKSWSGRRRRLL